MKLVENSVLSFTTLYSLTRQFLSSITVYLLNLE